MIRKCRTMLLFTFLLFGVIFAKAEAVEASLKVGSLDFDSVVEKSKFGKHEKETFEAMKKQMESILMEKEKKLSDLAGKLQDEDYLDSISAEAETELKREFRGLSQEFSGIQNQYMQTLQQANMKIMKKMSDIITKASEKVAEAKRMDLILNEALTFYSAPHLDVSEAIVTEMDRIWDEEVKENGGQPAGQPQPAAGQQKQNQQAQPSNPNNANRQPVKR